jgi:hypothetical protein
LTRGSQNTLVPAFHKSIKACRRDRRRRRKRLFTPEDITSNLVFGIVIVSSKPPLNHHRIITPVMATVAAARGVYRHNRLGVAA